MKKLTRIALPLIAVAIMSAPFMTLAQPPSTSYTFDAKAAEQDWNAAPPGPAHTRQGYRDGVLAAKLDTLVKRKIDPKVSHLYVHPPLRGKSKVAQYREAFESGYAVGLQQVATYGL